MFMFWSFFSDLNTFKYNFKYKVMIFIIFVVGLCQNIYLLFWMVCGGMVYGVHECFNYFFTVGAFVVFHGVSLWKVNGIDLYS